MENRTFKYKGWLCEWETEEQMYLLYTPDELDQPLGVRNPEWESETADMCKEFINSY